MIDLLRSLAVLTEPSNPTQRRIADLLDLPLADSAEHTRVFTLELHPYASVYLGPEGMLGGVARDRIAGFLRILGLTCPPEPDHLGVLLGAYASMLERGSDAGDRRVRAAWQHAAETMLSEHLLSWLPLYLSRFETSGADQHRSWAELLDKVLQTELERTPSVGSVLSPHLAEAPALPDPRADATSPFLNALLAPARSGIIVLQSDFRRLGHEVGLGLRMGERRFILGSLLNQQPNSVLTWLAQYATRCAETWNDHWAAGTVAGQWWRERASSTAQLLAELSATSVGTSRERECRRAP